MAFVQAPGAGPSAAVQDLGIGNDVRMQTQEEIDEMKRRKKLLGDRANAMSPAVQMLTGNSY